ncbi:uncharacterized protein LOC119678077 [Teleopsis dalmanni]|uniref:uncharacterized protein LOC119678077 n=1 Tax=Teleopsis dalmanni TaxID=139649 RepID=UPI000D32B157|nr:uncharacterized protein LOC119678077 [Teleopsis dalmanni]
MWDHFEQCPVEDETLSNMFSSAGVFKISSNDAIIKYPEVQATVQNKKIAIAIDQTIFLIEDENLAKCSLLSFNADINIIRTTNSGNLIICCLSNGEIHGIFIKGIPLFSLIIEAEDVNLTGKTFANIQLINQRFHISCTNGSIYCLSEIDEKPLENNMNISMTDNETGTPDEAILDNVTMKRILTNRSHKDTLTSVLVMERKLGINVENILCIAGTQNGIHLKNMHEDIIRIRMPEHYGGVKNIYNLDNFIVVLTNSGHLLEFCPITKIICFNTKQNEINLLIDDLIIMECSDKNIELLVVTKPNKDQRMMKIVQYPSFKCNSELDIPVCSWQVKQPKNSMNLYVLCGTQLNSSNIPTEVEMKLISETDPSDRFKKLIAKGHLEEAEDFGSQFELCLQPVFEAKAKRMLVDFSIADENTEYLQHLFDDLLDMLKRVGRKEFFKNNRMISMPTRQLLYRYLKEILKYLDEQDDENDVLDIWEQLHRLDTLKIIDPYECKVDWQNFVHNPYLIKEIIVLFKYDIPTACLIWKRHSSAILKNLDEKELEKLLDFIPANTAAFNLLQFLLQFVPTVGNTHPSVLPVITEWSIQKTRTLQYSSHWPEIGLEFMTKVAAIFENTCFLHSDVRRQLDSNIAKLKNLVNVLQELFVLKNSYNLIFTLDNYLQDSIDDSALYILQHVHLDHLQSLVKDFLYPIYQEKGKTPIVPIRNYISLLAGNHYSLSTWLERSIACIELLHNEDDRLESALKVMQCSPVPWPDAMAPLIKLRTSTHPLAFKINTEYEIQVIKIMKSKYGWPMDSATDINLNLFMFRIVKMNLPDMLEDIRMLTKAAPSISVGANFNCCYQLVRTDKPELAYELFKLLNADQNVKYVNSITEMFLEFMEKTEPLQNDMKDQKNLIDFLKLITPKTCHIYQKRLRALQNIFIIRFKYQIPIKSISDLVPTSSRSKMLNLGIENIVERSQAAINVSKFITQEIWELSAALEIPKMYGVRMICKRMKCLPLTCALSYSMLETVDCTLETKDEFIALAMQLLSQYICDNKKRTNYTLLSDNDPLVYPLAYKLLVRASLVDEDQQFDLEEIIKYIQIADNCYSVNAINAYYQKKDIEINNIICKHLVSTDSASNHDLKPGPPLDLVNNSTKTRNRDSMSVFDEIEVQPQIPVNKSSRNEKIVVIKFITNTLHLMVLSSKSQNQLLNMLEDLLSTEIQTDIDEVSDDFFLALEHLVKAKMHSIWYTIAQYLLDYQTRNGCKIINEEFLSLQLTRIFRYTLSNKDVNFVVLFAMLIACDDPDMLLQKLENDFKTDQQKVNLLTLVEQYNSQLNKPDHVEATRIQRIKYYYYMEFCKKDPSIKGKFSADFDNIEALLKEFHNKQLDIQLLERMSTDFELDYQQMLITQVIGLLRSQELQYDIKTNDFDEEELVVLSSADEILKSCQMYINEIKNTKLLTAKLQQFIKDINIYFYELYLCVIEILSFIDAVPQEMQVWSNILHFLRHKMKKRRRNRPGQLEMDMWLQSQKEIGILPKIARFRLPFLPLVENPLQDILESEISVDNCESWFPLIQMHTVLKGSSEVAKMCDYFCMSAVKNSITDYKLNNESETWNVQSKNNAFLRSVLRLVHNVKNPGKAFMILYFVATYAPYGADQVEATYECYKFAIENEDRIIEDKYQQRLEKVKRKYPILKTQHLLNVYGITDEKLMALIDNPVALIYNLYHHEQIIKESKQYISEVIKEIADLHNLELDNIQFELLQKWLSFTFDSTDGTIVDETFYEDQTMVENTVIDAGYAAENVLRAHYLLISWPKKESMQFLAAHIFPTDDTTNITKQLQIYECFSKLNDGTFSSVLNMPTQRQYMTIKCVHELKQLGYNTSPEKFSQLNKIEILKLIWQRSGQNASTLKTLANICLGFDIYLSKIWNGILKRMVAYNMVSELNALVDVLSCKAQLLKTEGLVAAWECVLEHPFKIANKTRSIEQEEELYKTMLRLQSCPVVQNLNLMKFTEHCLRLERLHMAAIFIPFCEENEKRENIKKLILSRKNNNLRKEILELEEAGILPTILNFVLKQLNL